MIAGNLFTRDYLLEGITRSQQWLALADGAPFCVTTVCTENLIRVDDVTESPKLVE